jgi:hypothetical protein
MGKWLKSEKPQYIDTVSNHQNHALSSRKHKFPGNHGNQ